MVGAWSLGLGMRDQGQPQGQLLRTLPPLEQGWEPLGPQQASPLPKCDWRILLFITVLLKRVQEIHSCSPDGKITDRDFVSLVP